MTDGLVGRRIRRHGRLDWLTDGVQRGVGRMLVLVDAPVSALSSALHGIRIEGHPLRPVLTDLPVRVWITWALVDFVARFTGPATPTSAPSQPRRASPSVGWDLRTDERSQWSKTLGEAALLP